MEKDKKKKCRKLKYISNSTEKVVCNLDMTPAHDQTLYTPEDSHVLLTQYHD